MSEIPQEALLQIVDAAHEAYCRDGETTAAAVLGALDHMGVRLEKREPSSLTTGPEYRFVSDWRPVYGR